MLMTRGAMSDLTPVPGSSDEDALIALHVHLVRLLGMHGVLLGSTEDWRRLNGAVDALEDDERHKWYELFSYLERCGRLFVHHEPPDCLDDTVALKDVLAALPAGRHIAVLATTKAAAIGLDARTPSRIEKEQELVRSRRVTDARRLHALVALADRGMYLPGVSRDVLFDEVLRPIAAWSTEVLIADRYLFNQLQWRADHRTRAPAEAVVWLLDKLAQHARKGTIVTLLGGVGETGQPQTAAGAAELVRREWSPSRMRVDTVLVRAAHWPSFSFKDQLAHDRHIAFGCDLAIKFIEGLDRLREPDLWDPNGTWWTYAWTPEAISAIRDAEDRMTRAAHATPELVTNPRLGSSVAA